MKQMSIVRSVVAGSACLVCGLAGAEPVDGFMWGPVYYAPFNGLTAQYWENGVVAKDGGVAYFTGTGAPKLSFDTAWTLRGIDFGNTKVNNSAPAVSGGHLTLTGDAFLSGTGRGSNAAGWDLFGIVNSTVSGTGANTLSKRDCGALRVDAAFVNFGTLAACGGWLRTLATSGSLFAANGTTMAVRGGTFDWQPNTAAGASASASMGATTYGRFGGSIAWAKGSGTAATLTLASLTPEDAAGNTLVLEPSGGAATLGGSEKLLVTTPPEQVNGMLDPGIVVREKGVESYPVRFTRYDDANGVVAYPVSAMTDLATATATDVAVVTATNTLSVSKQVAALSIENTANLDIASGVTLTVGDGTHPAGVIVNMQNNKGGDVSHRLQGQGTLAFGTSPGILWMSSPTTPAGGWGGTRRTFLSTRITGSAGVTFASGSRDNGAKTTGIFGLPTGYSAGWTGPTRVSGCLLWVDDVAALPAGDIHVLNGSGLGGTLRLSVVGTLAQNIYLAGRGSFDDSEMALQLANGFTTFDGLVTLTDDAWIGGSNNGKCGIHFRHGVKGPGSLYLANAGTYNFYEPSTYGDLRVMGAGTAINLNKTATFGTGRIWVRAANVRFGLSDVENLVVTNAFRCDSTAPTLALEHSTPTLDTDARFVATVFTNFSSLAISGKVDLGAFQAFGARDTSHPQCQNKDKTTFTAKMAPEKISASRAGAEVLIGTGANGVLAVPLADGAGTLAFTKKGAGTLEMPVGITNAYSGATKVAAGTLRLNDDPFLSQSLVWWLDAAREQDFDKAADGTVTNWHSRAGSANVTFTASGANPVWGAATMNGHPVVKMSDVKAQLKGDKKTWHRTVFVVCRVDEPRNLACLFGASTADYGECGIRINGSAATSPWDLDNIGHYVFNTTGWTRSDGKSGGTCGQGVTHILTTIHDRDNWTANQWWANPTVVPYFTPVLNYYGSSRPFLGDYAEVIAFDRVLSEIEVRRVENYLSEKWKGQTIWTDAQVAAPAVLPAATALEVATDATLDLNGVSVTVASLAGNGTITNSSAKAATLTVTGNAAFTGHVGGPVKLVTGGTAQMNAVVTEGATLAASAGTLATGVHAFTPPTDGLAYWCDAGKSETVLCNASGSVTSWVSRATSSATALVNPGTTMPGASVSKSRPVFNADTAAAMAGRPGVYFANAGRALWADVASPVRTVFIVAMLSANQNNCNGLWGPAGRDCGFRFNSNNTTLEGATSVVRPTASTDRVRMDGLSTFGFGLNTVRVFSARFESTDASFFSAIGLESPTPSRTTTLGAYCGNPGLEGYVGEVIAYDRALSDAEMLQVEGYLANKWQKTAWTAGNPPAETEATFAGGALAVAAGASVTVPNGTRVGPLAGGGTLVGDVTTTGIDVEVKPGGSTDTLTVNGALTLDPESTLTVSGLSYLKNGVFNTFLRATTLTGAFGSTNLAPPYYHRLKGGEGVLYRLKGLTVIVR